MSILSQVEVDEEVEEGLYTAHALLTKQREPGVRTAGGTHNHCSLNQPALVTPTTPMIKSTKQPRTLTKFVICENPCLCVRTAGGTNHNHDHCSLSQPASVAPTG